MSRVNLVKSACQTDGTHLSGLMVKGPVLLINKLLLDKRVERRVLFAVLLHKQLVGFARRCHSTVLTAGLVENGRQTGD